MPSPSPYSMLTHQGCIFDQAYTNVVPVFKCSRIKYMNATDESFRNENVMVVI